MRWMRRWVCSSTISTQARDSRRTQEIQIPMSAPHHKDKDRHSAEEETDCRLEKECLSETWKDPGSPQTLKEQLKPTEGLTWGGLCSWAEGWRLMGLRRGSKVRRRGMRTRTGKTRQSSTLKPTWSILKPNRSKRRVWVPSTEPPRTAPSRKTTETRRWPLNSKYRTRPLTKAECETKPKTL